MQRGESIGHAIDDDVKLQIMGKALSCSPPIQLEIYIENLGYLPFFRVEIPSGRQKPYSTPNGTYKIRENGRNGPLLPEALLSLFLDKEGEEFRKRFSGATGNLEVRMSEALELVSRLEHVISRKIEDIASTIGWAEDKAGDAANTIETVLGHVTRLASETKKHGQRIKSLILKTGADDPVKKKLESEVIDALVEQLKKNPTAIQKIREGQSLSMELNGDAVEELDVNDIEKRPPLIRLPAAKARCAARVRASPRDPSPNPLGS
jgi:hypothetical protein